MWKLEVSITILLLAFVTSTLGNLGSQLNGVANGQDAGNSTKTNTSTAQPPTKTNVTTTVSPKPMPSTSIKTAMPSSSVAPTKPTTNATTGSVTTNKPATKAPKKGSGSRQVAYPVLVIFMCYILHNLF